MLTADIFLKDHKGLLGAGVKAKKESFGLFLLALQQIILESASHSSMTFFYIVFLETLVANVSILDGAEFADWNYSLTQRMIGEFFEDSLEQSQVSSSELLNEKARKVFTKGRTLAKFWLRLNHLHQTTPKELIKALSQQTHLTTFVDEQYANKQVSPGVENKVLHLLADRPNQVELVQTMNPFANFKSSSKQANLGDAREIESKLAILDLVTNISRFLIFLNKTLFLLVRNEDLEASLKDNLAHVWEPSSPEQKCPKFDASRLKTTKRRFEEEIQEFMDTCKLDALQLFLDKLEGFLDMQKRVDRDQLKRVLELIVFRKFQFLKGESDQNSSEFM